MDTHEREKCAVVKLERMMKTIEEQHTGDMKKMEEKLATA